MKKNIESIEGVFGDHLTIELIDFFKDNKESIKWAYAPHKDFNYESPIDAYSFNPQGVTKAIDNLYVKRYILKKLSNQN